MPEKAKPSLLRIIQSDFLALFGLLVPAVSLIMYISVAYIGFFPGLRGHDPIQGSQGAPLFLYLSLAGLIIGLPLAYWRIRSIQQIFSNGIDTLGHITDISFYRDRGRVVYSYSHQGQSYTAKNAIMKTSKTQQLRSGDEVAVLINPDEPKQALIRDLYV